jgi:Zn-dependent peptidase ImmA (M78 family)
MKFKINEDEWKIELQNKDTLLSIYNKDSEEQSTFAFGVTIYPEHKILINKDMCVDQQIKTLKHELTHCYIWNSGLYNVPNFSEEMVCDLVSCINNFINEIVNKWKEYNKKKVE